MMAYGGPKHHTYYLASNNHPQKLVCRNPRSNLVSEVAISQGTQCGYLEVVQQVLVALRSSTVNVGTTMRPKCEIDGIGQNMGRVWRNLTGMFGACLEELLSAAFFISQISPYW